MKRLRETNAPKHHPMFGGWISGGLNNPEKPPQLKSAEVEDWTAQPDEESDRDVDKEGLTSSDADEFRA
jgi:hypothetical protein